MLLIFATRRQFQRIILITGSDQLSLRGRGHNIVSRLFVSLVST